MAVIEIDHKKNLNRLAPAAARAQLGSCLYDLIQNFNALLAKLDNDPGVQATDHAATLRVKLPEER